jgi:hypothetical protein
MSMPMSKTGGKHMSADAADKFEEAFEGEDFGTFDDWETDLGLKILKIEEKLSTAAGKANVPVNNMLQKKLITYNSALEFLSENAKAAALIGSQGGLQSIIAYITKQAVEDSTRAETRKYSNKLIPFLPGYQLSSGLSRMTGLIGSTGGRGSGAKVVGAAPTDSTYMGAS